MLSKIDRNADFCPFFFDLQLLRTGGVYVLFLVVFTVFHDIAYSSSDLGCSKRSFFCFHPPTSTTICKDLGGS